jgi:uncharacterized protein YjbI with pentapeptide repeats
MALLISHARMAAFKARLLAAKVKAQGIGKAAGRARRYMTRRIDARILLATAAVFGGVSWLWWRLSRIDLSIIVAAAAIVGGGVALWWRLPKLKADRLQLTIRDPKARADVEDYTRKTIGQLLGGAAVLIGAGLAYVQFTQQQQASRDLLISNQVSKGFEQLGQAGSDKVVVRLGGIYALEGVMNTSEQYHRPVLEALSAFVRDSTRNETGEGPPTTDIQAALTVIGRRNPIGEPQVRGSGKPDLADAHIPKANLSNSNLSDANLSETNLSGVNLSGAKLSGADLSGANLSSANLSSLFLSRIAREGYGSVGSLILNMSGAADLSGANLFNAKLDNANLQYAKLSGASFLAADLTSADLTGADLSKAALPVKMAHARLVDANLVGANLVRADLTGADLTGADLTGATVYQTELDKACGAKAKLDFGLTLKPCSTPVPPKVSVGKP